MKRQGSDLLNLSQQSPEDNVYRSHSYIDSSQLFDSSRTPFYKPGLDTKDKPMNYEHEKVLHGIDFNKKRTNLCLSHFARQLPRGAANGSAQGSYVHSPESPRLLKTLQIMALDERSKVNEYKNTIRLAPANSSDDFRSLVGLSKVDTEYSLPKNVKIAKLYMGQLSQHVSRDNNGASGYRVPKLSQKHLLSKKIRKRGSLTQSTK